MEKGEIFKFGFYYEEIEWLVLEKNENKILAVTKNCIDSIGAVGKAVIVENNGKYNVFPERHSNAFVYFLSGKIDFIYDDVSFSAEENTFVFLPQGKKYKTLPRQRGDFLIINFHTETAPVIKAFAFKPTDAKSFIHEMNSAAKKL